MARHAGEEPGVPDPMQPVRLVVGLGSSAGGLEALQQVLAQLTPNSGTTYVVAQHLAPDHPSVIAELLDNVSALRVESAEDGKVLEPDVILVGPPNRDLMVDGSVVRVMPPSPRLGPAPNIDALFSSIAEFWPGRSVAVVLSGTGSDGADGLRLVRATGSLTIAQLPETARFDAMPRAAVEFGGADLVLAPMEIGARLASLGGDATDWTGESLADPDDAVVSALAAVLRRTVGIDFSQYKESTVRRQVRRRMAVRQATTVPEYMSILSADINEAHALARNLLVTVTSFFRDPEAFAAIADELRRWIASHPAHEQLRVWVPGCATGEEVYSLAMICSDALGDPANLVDRLRIFGTDLDEVSLGVARRAIYRSSNIVSIPEHYRLRYVTVGADGAEINAALRRCVVFARHNVAENPPFPRIDLVSCRNTLIYFTATLQEQVLHLIRYALSPGGLLFLGSAEAAGARTPGFTVVDAAHRIFERVESNDEGSPIPKSVRAPRLVAPLSKARRAVGEEARREHQHVDVLEALLRVCAGPSLVLDEHHDLVEVVGDVTPFCRVPEGRLLASAESFVRPELREEATAMSLMVQPGDAPIIGRSISMGNDAAVHMVAQPLLVAGRHLVVLTFMTDDGALALGVPEGRQARADREIERLERELIASHQSLRTSTAELQAVNEELEASSEELQASSEELQSSIEELEASNEELEASNEELGGLNAELRVRNAEQEVLNADLRNIQASLSQGMVMVDNELRITRFTPLAVRVFALVDADIGSLLSEVLQSVPIPGLDEALKDVVSGLPLRSLEALGAEHSYVVQVAPYIDLGGRRRGAIITLTDVTEMATLRAIADDAIRELTTVVDTLDEVVWKRDLAFSRVEFVSKRVFELSGWSAAELMQDPSVFDACIEADALERVRSARAEGAQTWVVEYPVRTRDGRRRSWRESAVVVPESRGSDGYVVGTLADVTDRIATDVQVADLSMTFKAVFETRLFGVAVLDAAERVVMANEAFCSLVGYDELAVRGLQLSAFGPSDRVATNHQEADGSASDDPLVAGSQEMVRRDGTRRVVTVDLRPLAHPAGEAVSIVIVQDVTALSESVEGLARQARFDESVTGLLNRSSFSAALERDIDRCARKSDALALLWLDLDRFKEINDQHGHHAGDMVLKVAAERLVEVVRGGDAVGRLGGDEFGIIVEGMDRVDSLAPLLQRVLAALREPIAVGDATVIVAGSVGVALYPSDGTTVNDLMRAADTAMYAAKAQGGDAASNFNDEMSSATERRRSMRIALGDAIEGEQFEFYYQPILFAADRSLWGVEALLRWNRDGEMVSANDFIPFTEETGQIRQLGPLTFSLLRRDLERLRAAGLPEVLVSVNMSVMQLEDHMFTDQLALWPMASGLEGLVVEVVESIFLPGNSRALDTLGVLTSHGAKVSIDDFGSGFSNLLLLETLSPAFVKLDRSMLLTGTAKDRGRALVRCAVELSHALGALAVVEGVETEVHLDLATSLGADLLQGYLLARPMPLDDLVAWLSRRTAITV